MTGRTIPRSQTKFSIIVLIVDHYDTFRNYDSKKVNPLDYLIYVGIPVGIAILTFFLKLEANNVSDILAAAAILTGLIFNGVLLTSDLSARTLEIAKGSPRREQTIRLAEELRANISYGVLVGLCLSALLGSISMFTDTEKPLSY